ncbi:DUF2787 domain-containing protein [Shewanella eurypsychrophilus]|uniref:DUF2787 domain-containing protein n=1 Tax=Shewanella eurypsychrophilus TaxID=2593656 RepID=A0ABX6V1U1_9GAMM|nr:MULTISPECIES: DUF2787 family protein [Shewanella]QFU21274.1 DUF2787 domain-containing protein [Shewanella sp. YLB-09]QPG56565.1 DUF2787 domain-containing protein [Shewanella eurypsychrophilus]
MTIKIKHQDLFLPVSPMLALHLADLISNYEAASAVTINFRDPNYSAERGGFHPVEVRLEKEVNEEHGNQWRICYITDFSYVGVGYMAELAKELDFDFDNGIFRHLMGATPIEQAREIYQVWVQNFLAYSLGIKAYLVKVTSV